MHVKYQNEEWWNEIKSFTRPKQQSLNNISTLSGSSWINHTKLQGLWVSMLRHAHSVQKLATRLKFGALWLFIYILYDSILYSFLMMPSQVFLKCTSLFLGKKKTSYNMTLPPPCFRVGMVFFRWSLSPPYITLINFYFYLTREHPSKTLVITWNLQYGIFMPVLEWGLLPCMTAFSVMAIWLYSWWRYIYSTCCLQVLHWLFCCCLGLQQKI